MRIINITIFLLFIAAALPVKAAMPSYSYSSIYMYDNQDASQSGEQNSDVETISDPLKILNKHIFYINSMLDTIILAPTNKIYVTILPKRGRTMVSCFINNMTEPLNLINMIFQGHFGQARIAFGRFITNTLWGLGGLFDPATQMNLKYISEDFGQSMASYGMGTGPYLVAPLLGPTTLRDLSGKVVDYFMDPFKYVLNKKPREIIDVVWIVQKRSDANDVINNINQSLDPYETAKQIYIQYRRNQIKLNQQK